MSSQSKIEGYSDRVLFLIIKYIVDKCDDEGINWKLENYNSEISDIVQESFRPFGIESNTYEDDDFIWSLLKNNLDVIGEEKLSKPLNRPELKKYKYQVAVNETIYQTVYYQHTIETYSNKPYYMVRTMEEQGEFEYWDGDETYRDVHDSETNEITIERKFTEI